MIQSDIYFRVRLYPINIHNYNMEIVNTKPQKEKKDSRDLGAWSWSENKAGGVAFA